MSAWPRTCSAVVSIVVLLAAGCVAEHVVPEASGVTGAVELALSARGSRGNLYRLSGAVFEVEGPSQTTLSSEGDSENIVADFPVGTYRVELLQGWQLIRVADQLAMDATVRDVSLEGVVVQASSTTTVRFSFDLADGEEVAFGRIEVGIEVDEGQDGVTTAECASEPLRSVGEVHYFCSCDSGAAPGCVAGADENDGLSSTRPKRSWEAAMETFNTMPAGDTVALCRGGMFRGVTPQGSLRNLNCRADNTCDLRDYGDAAKGRPILDGNGSSDQLFNIGWYQNYSQTPVQGMRFYNLDLRNIDTAWVVAGSATDIDICNVNMQDMPGAAVYIVTNSTTKRVALRNSALTRVGLSGQAYLGACDDCSVDGNVFDHTGGPSSRDHPIYVGSNPELCTSGCTEPIQGGSGIYHRTHRMRISNNSFSHSSQRGGVCVGAIIVVHEPHDDLLIENNFLYEDPEGNGGCYGISISSGLDEPGQWRRAVIRRNQLYNTGYLPISVDNCQDCAIDSNLIVGSAEMYAIRAPNYRADVGVGPNLVNTRTKIRNNTIYFGPNAGSPGGEGIRAGSEGEGYEVTNNTIYYGPSTKPNGWKCFNFDGPAGSYGSREGNACYSNVADDSPFKTYITADPLFVNGSTDPATANFSPGAGSPLISAATTSVTCPTAIASSPWLATDVGKIRDAQPDIGAYER